MSGLLVKLRNRMRDTGGAAIALVALTMVVLLSCVALAIDVGMLVTARTEAQTVADGAALEGARELRDSQGNVAQARTQAMLAGSSDNTVRGENVSVLEGDVDVIPEEWTVRVRVHRTADRGNAVPTFFARIFGVNEVNIVTNAAAWAAASTTIGAEDDQICHALPLALLDKYEEDNGEPGWQSPEVITGWSPDDHGILVKLKVQPSQSGDPEDPPVSNEIDYCNDTGGSSWRCWWRMEDEDPNTENVEEKIRAESCTDPLTIGDDSVYNAAGNMQSILAEFQDLIAAAEDMHGPLTWNDDPSGSGTDLGCVWSVEEGKCYTGESLLVREVPIVDPTSITGSGQNIRAHVTGAMGVFVEKVAAQYDGSDSGSAGQQNVYLRLIYGAGSGTAGESEENDEEGMVRTLQLIE